MHSALVMTEFGLQVRRFSTTEAAQAAEANRETDGIGVSLMPMVCCRCGRSLGAKVCAPAMAGKISHGMCRGGSCAVSSATAGRDRQNFGPTGGAALRLGVDAERRTSPVGPLNDASSPKQQPKSGPSAASGVNGTAAPGTPPAALEHLSGGPAASFTFFAPFNQEGGS